MPPGRLFVRAGTMHALENREIDILFRSTSHTTSREEFGAFTQNYFLSGPRIAINVLNGARSLEELDGYYVAAQAGSSSELYLHLAAASLGVDLVPLAFEDMGEACLVFLNGDVDALVADWIELMNCTSGDPNLPIIGELLSEYEREDGTLGGETMAAMVPLGNEAFRDDVDTVLDEFFEDGTWWAFYDRYFGPEPWSLEEMRAEPPANR